MSRKKQPIIYSAAMRGGGVRFSLHPEALVDNAAFSYVDVDGVETSVFDSLVFHKPQFQAKARIVCDDEGRGPWASCRGADAANGFSLRPHLGREWSQWLLDGEV